MRRPPQMPVDFGHATRNERALWIVEFCADPRELVPHRGEHFFGFQLRIVKMRSFMSSNACSSESPSIFSTASSAHHRTRHLEEFSRVRFRSRART